MVDAEDNDMKNQSFLLAVTMMGCALQASAESVQTFEVEVDDTAEVEVSGAEGRIRT